MITRNAKVKKFAGTALVATAVTAVGFGLGSGTAQAKPSHPHPHPVGTSTQNSFSTQLHNFIQFTDTNIADPIQALWRWPRHPV
jgi:hypothetical protein